VGARHGNWVLGGEGENVVVLMGSNLLGTMLKAVHAPISVLPEHKLIPDELSLHVVSGLCAQTNHVQDLIKQLRISIHWRVQARHSLSGLVKSLSLLVCLNVLAAPSDMFESNKGCLSSATGLPNSIFYSCYIRRKVVKIPLSPKAKIL